MDERILIYKPDIMEKSDFLSKEVIAFRRGRVLVSNNELIDPRVIEDQRNSVLVSLLKELKIFGYYLSSEAMCRLTIEDMEGIHKNLLPYLYEVVDHHGNEFKPLYPGFPEQVLSLSEMDLWINQQRVYSGDLDGFIKDNPWVSDPEKRVIEQEPDKLLKVLSIKEFMDIPRQMMSAGNSLTAETREELVWFLENYPDLPIPERIPFKETMCIVAKYRPEYEIGEVNDILRYGLYLMGADPSLPNVPKEIRANSWSRKKVDNPEWRKLSTLPRSKRREICQRIEKIIERKGVGNCIRDAKSFYGHWILLSERVHPKEYVVNYPECADFFVKLKNKNLQKEFRTFNSQVQGMYDTGKDIIEIAKFVSTRPGELIRRFDSILRRALEEGKESDIMDIFINTQGMKNKTLLEILSYYDKRGESAPRMVNIPGTGFYQISRLEPINPGYLEVIKDNIIRKILLNIDTRVTEKDLDGKIVYLDPQIKKIPIPKGMRTQNISVPKGMRYKLKSNIVRFFVHWIQAAGRSEDLDLHAFLYKSEDQIDNIGWNTGLARTYAVHSGDVLNQPGKCAEYVDVDLDACRKAGFKYVVMDVCNYKGRGMDTLPVWLGYSNRTSIQGGNKFWHPEDVDLTIPVTSKTDSVAAMMVDIENREMILLDCETSGLPVNNAGNYGLQKAIVNFFSKPEKYTSFDIMKQHYISRGATVVEILPEEGSEIEIKEKVLFEDISKDYVKILDIIGE